MKQPNIEQIKKEAISEFFSNNGKKAWESQRVNYKDLRAEMKRRQELGAKKHKEYWDWYRKTKKEIEK